MGGRTVEVDVDLRISDLKRQHANEILQLKTSFEAQLRELLSKADATLELRDALLSEEQLKVQKLEAEVAAKDAIIRQLQGKVGMIEGTEAQRSFPASLVIKGQDEKVKIDEMSAEEGGSSGQPNVETPATV
jgi:hypothetical protein